MAEKQKKKRNPLYVSPVGEAVFPYLVEPDEYQGKETYKTDLVIEPDSDLFTNKGENVGNIQEFLDAKNTESFERFTEEYKGKKDKKNKPIKVEEADAPYYFNDQGKMVIRVKMNAKGKTRDGEEFTQRPALFDAKGKPMDLDALWGGSKLKVSFEIVPYYMASTQKAGITLRLKAAQVIELRAPGQGGPSADAYGFGEEDGYDHDDADDADDHGFGDETNGQDDEDGNNNGDF